MGTTDDSNISTPLPGFTRRRALSLLAMTGASLLVGNTSSFGFFQFFDGASSATPEAMRKLGISQQWQKTLGPQLPAYVGYLQSLKLRHVTVAQIVEPHTKVHGSIHNTLPPKAIWKNIKNTLKVVDALAYRLEMPIDEVVSVYRSPAYNSTCPGAKSNSYHLRNNAMDIRFDCAPGKVAAMARAMRSTGLFQGGVGRYSSFTHVDTRGKNADW